MKKSQAGGARTPTRNEASFQPAAEQPARGEELPRNAWLIGSILIMLAGAALRLYDLGLVPMHHDEGVNGNFLVILFRQGHYRYDPSNYHGPTLYYFALAASYLLGLNTFAVRLVTGIFGLATVWLVLLLRRRIGALGALAAAALIAVSPGAVYLSRYFIHETLFVFFTLGIAYAFIRYQDEAEPVYLWLAALSAALLFATKETAMISAAVFLIALACTALYGWLRKTLAGGPGSARVPAGKAKNWQATARAEQPQSTLDRFGGPTVLATHVVVAVLVFVVVSVLFYSSFFTNYPQGVKDALGTFKFWTKTGKEAHVHPWYKYLSWLWQEESPLLVLGAFGALAALWRGRNRFALFVGLWAFGLLAAYSLVPYKTPWLTLNFIVPLAIASGYGVNAIYRMAGEWMGRLPALFLAGSLAAAALAVCLVQSLSLNFRHYDDEQYAYVYAHTRREMLALVQEVERLAVKGGSDKQTGIAIVSPDYWPLPWYFRDYTRVGYFGRIVETSEALVIGNEGQEAELLMMLGDRYVRVGSYALRPGVTLVLYARRDLLSR